MSANVDFRTLTLMDALDLAILIEDEAKDRYEELAAQMDVHHTGEAADFFRFMVENETKHGETLRQRRKSSFGDAASRVSSSMVFDVEAPGYEEVRAFMTPRQALEVALHAERKAFTFFESALAALPAGEVRSLLAELRDEEREHEAMVLAQIAKLPADSPVSVADYEDEPAAQ